MPSGKPQSSRPQIVFRVETEQERDDFVRAAGLRGERDMMGAGGSAALRRLARNYVRAAKKEFGDPLPSPDGD